MDLRFVDDVALTTEDVKDKDHQLNTMNEESTNFGLKMYKGKTKFMINTDTKGQHTTRWDRNKEGE